jgi:hypothetical protein
VTSRRLERFAGVSAILAGLLRIISSFYPFDAVTAEAVYLAIDLLILAGLGGIYLSRADRMGWLGLFGFVIAFAGAAIIVGPDGVLFDVDEYQLGASLLTLGLALLAGASLLGGAYPIWVPLLWIGTFLAALAASFMPNASFAFVAAGVLFGASFIAAGYELLRDPGPR